MHETTSVEIRIPYFFAHVDGLTHLWVLSYFRRSLYLAIAFRFPIQLQKNWHFAFLGHSCCGLGMWWFTRRVWSKHCLAILSYFIFYREENGGKNRTEISLIGYMSFQIELSKCIRLEWAVKSLHADALWGSDFPCLDSCTLQQLSDKEPLV